MPYTKNYESSSILTWWDLHQLLKSSSFLKPFSQKRKQRLHYGWDSHHDGQSVKKEGGKEEKAGLCMFILLICTVNSVNGADGSMGLQAAFIGGPVLSAVGILEIDVKLSFKLPVGGFPGSIFRTEMNCIYNFGPLNERWSTHLLGGFGCS